MNKKEFANLIKRCISGQATKRETALFEEWLDQRSEKDPFGELSLGEREQIRADRFKNISSIIRSSGGNVRNKKIPAVSTAFHLSAAALILLSVLTYSILKGTTSFPEEEIATTQSESTPDKVKKVILSDSTIVWLKGNSSIVYPDKFNGKERSITLIGEALFEVARDPEHPFIIQCGGLRTKVLGTSFNIKSYQDHIEVLVLTGSVTLSSEGNDKDLIVLPNEKVVYHEAKNKMTKVTAKEHEKIAKAIGTEYSMRFNGTRMKEVIRRIEGKFDVRVSLSDERLNNCPITADFTGQSLDRTLSMISQTLEIEYEIDHHEITLEGEGCD